jgi:hypothetical protein
MSFDDAEPPDSILEEVNLDKDGGGLYDEDDKYVPEEDNKAAIDKQDLELIVEKIRIFKSQRTKSRYKAKNENFKMTAKAMAEICKNHQLTEYEHVAAAVHSVISKGFTISSFRCTAHTT